MLFLVHALVLSSFSSVLFALRYSPPVTMPAAERDVVSVWIFPKIFRLQRVMVVNYALNVVNLPYLLVK